MGTKTTVQLLWDQKAGAEHAQRVKSLFDKCHGPIKVELRGHVVVTPDEGDEVSWDYMFDLLQKTRQQRRVDDEDVLFLLTGYSNTRNYYCVENPDGPRDAFGHVGDFSWATRAPAQAISVHYLLVSVFKTLIEEAGADWNAFSHEDTRGCFSDFCEYKSDLDFKLRTGDICGDCLEGFQKLGLPEGYLRQLIALLQLQRRMSLGIGPYLEEEDSFGRWPFPVAITRHKAKQATAPFSRLKYLVDHLDSLVRYSYLASEALLDRVPAVAPRAAFGDWVQLLARCQDRRHVPVVQEIEEQKLVKLRNDFIGHDYHPIDAGPLAEPIHRLENSLQVIESTLDPFLSAYTLLVPTSIALVDGSYVVQMVELRGSHLLHRILEKRLDRPPSDVGISNSNVVYVCDTSMERFQTLGGNIRMAQCTQCHTDRVFVSDGGADYLDVFAGHRVRLQP
jgi:hypothetical protein